MIALTRQRAAPPIHGNFRDPRRRELSRRLLEEQRQIRRNEIDKHPFDSGIWKEAKEQLLAESHGKCAYCETPTNVVAYGDVEHYRPKSKYWWLAYSLDNYLVSCALCNQKFKKDKFPISGPKWRGPRVSKNTTDQKLDELASTIAPEPLSNADVNRYIADHMAERPLLLNPYLSDPGQFFAWRPDDILAEVELVENPAVAGSAQLVEQALKVYGLNRLELKQLRYKTFLLYRANRNIATRADVPADLRNDSAAIINRMLQDDWQFSGMIRFFEAAGGPPPPNE